MTPPQRWHILDFDDKSIAGIQKRFGVSRYFARALAEKGLTTDHEISRILSPGFAHLHPATLLPDIEAGSQRIKHAIKRGERILIWGDEDTDGITSSVFLYELLQSLNARVSYHIPSRHDEGIGLNAEGVNHAARTGCSLIVTVDSASSDAELIQRARTKGVDVVVTDHHETDMEGTLPYPLINPKRKDATYPFRAIAGVAVAFKLGWHLAVSLLSLSPGEWDSIATEWYPLVFLGTYGDKVPLRDENWTLAHIGYHALKKTTRKGLRILTEMLSENGDWDEAMLQKMISVFSTGKTESWGNNLSFRILTETDITFLRETISQLIQKSDAWHAEANANYKKILSEATYDPGTDIVTVYCPAVPHEYLGFCASRLKERYGKPIVAMSEKGDTIVGEARAPKGFDILRVLSGTNQLFLSFGGHKPACGFALDKEKLDEVRSYLSQDFPDIASVEDTKAELRIIGELPLEDLTDEIKGEILSLIPFGADNSPPLFLAKKISFSQGEYSLCVPETGEQKQIDLRGNSQSWTGMNGKPLLLDVVYYLNTAGTLIIADSRPSVFNESGDRTYPDSGNGQR